MVDGDLEELLDDLGAGASRVFGHVANGEPAFDRDVDRFGRAARDEIDVPLLGELADRRASDEKEGFHRHAGLLRNLDHRRDVADDGATGDAGLHGELRALNRFAHLDDVVEGALRAPRQSDVGTVNADVVHEMQDLDLRLDRRVDDARVLQPVAQRLVEKRHALRNQASPALDFIPIVNEIVLAHVKLCSDIRTAARRS
jgi:hypothetical protein